MTVISGYCTNQQWPKLKPRKEQTLLRTNGLGEPLATYSVEMAGPEKNNGLMKKKIKTLLLLKNINRLENSVKPLRVQYC